MKNYLLNETSTMKMILNCDILRKCSYFVYVHFVSPNIPSYNIIAFKKHGSVVSREDEKVEGVHTLFLLE